MGNPYPGACVCHSVRFLVRSEPLTFYACHCTDCQRHTGSAFALHFFVPRESIELLSGPPAEYATTLPDGRQRRGAYCPACASRVWVHSVRRPSFVAIQAGVLETPPSLEPVAHLWVRSKRRFVTLSGCARQYETQPSDAMELFALWKAGNHRDGSGA